MKGLIDINYKRASKEAITALQVFKAEIAKDMNFTDTINDTITSKMTSIKSKKITNNKPSQYDKKINVDFHNIKY